MQNVPWNHGYWPACSFRFSRGSAAGCAFCRNIQRQSYQGRLRIQIRSNNLYPSQQNLRRFEKNVTQTDLAPFSSDAMETKLTRDKETCIFMDKNRTSFQLTTKTILLTMTLYKYYRWPWLWCSDLVQTLTLNAFPFHTWPSRTFSACSRSSSDLQ